MAGGTYIEECVAPPSLSLLGSGGRAALALADLEPVVLHTFHPDPADILANFGLGSVVHRSASRIRFRYLHPLARPDFSYDLREKVPPVRLTAPKALRFGCLEGDFQVDAQEAVYDPQGGGAPFRANGSSARKLAVILNEWEARDITGLAEPVAAARALMDADGAEVVVLKRGPSGALVLDREHEHPLPVPAFRTAVVGKIGSGDVFSAMFCHYWLTRGLVAAHAAELASRQVADYVATRVLPRPAEPPAMDAVSPGSSPPRVMVVADTETTAGLWLAAEAAEVLADLGATRVDAPPSYGMGGMQALADTCDVVLVLPGTAAGKAVGVARSVCVLGIPCVVFSELPEVSDALTGTGATVLADFAASLYSAFWAGA